MRVIGVGIPLIALAAGCMALPATPPSPGAFPLSQAATEIVIARDMTFNPATVTVLVGGTVIWKFEGPSPHSTTSDPGAAQAWDSGILGPGATYTVKFDRPGVYPYHCTPHAALGMRGTVVVR